MVSEVTVPKMPPCTRGRRGFGGCCGVIFVILLFISSRCLRGELNMPNPSEGESPTTPQNLTGAEPAVITVPVNIPLPRKLDLSGGNLAVKWQRLSRAWSNYDIAAQLKDPENQDRNKERLGETRLVHQPSPSVSHQVNEWFASLVQDNTLLLKKLSCMGKLMQELWLA